MQATQVSGGLASANASLQGELAQLRIDWEAASSIASEAADTGRELSVARGRITALESSAASLTAEMQTLERRVAEADSSLAARETELAASFESTQRIESELGEANRRLVESEQRAEGVAQENSTMREQLQSVAAELAQTAENLTASRTELITLSEQVESLEQSEEQLQQTQQEVINLELQIVATQTALSEREIELTALRGELITTGDTMQQQDASRFLLESQIATLTESVSSAQASGAQAEGMAAELTTARERLGEFESTLEAETIENESLRRRVAELDGILEQRESENGAIQGQVISLTQQLEGARSKLVGTVVIEAQFAENLVRLEATEIELAASRSKVEGVTTQLEVASGTESPDAVRLDELRAMAAQLERQLDERSIELVVTRSELAELRLTSETRFDLDTGREAANEKVDTLTQDLAAQNQLVTQRDENLRTLRSQLKATTDTANVRERENRELRGELRTLRDRLVATETSLSKTENLAADLATFQAQVVSLEARLGAAGEGKAAGEARINNLTTEIATKTSAVNVLRAQIDDTSSQLGAAREKLMLAEQNGSALNTQRQNLQNRLAKSEQNLEIATTRKTEIEVELETARAREVELQNQVTEVRDEAGKQRMAAEVQRLSDELGLWRDMAAQRDIELTQAKAALTAENTARADEILNFQTVSSLQLETIEQNETELAQLRRDLSARSDELTTLKAEEDARGGVIETLEQQLADAFTRLAAAEELESKLLLAETEAAERGSELERLRPRLERAELEQRELNKSVRTLRVNLADANTETVETQRSASAVTGQLSAKVSDLERELTSTRAAAVEYRRQAEALSATTEEKAAILGQVADLERQLEEAQGSVAVLESTTQENQLLQTNIDEISTDLQAALGQLAELREERENLIARLDEQTALVGSLEGNAAAWSTRETELSAQIEQLEGVVTKLETDLTASLQNARATESIAVERSEREIDSLRTEIVRLQGMVSDLTGAQQALADRQNLVVALQAQLDRARFEAREVDELANEKAGEQIEALTVRLARAEAELLDQEDRVALAEAAVEERAQAEVASLTAQLVEAEQQVEALRSQNGEIEQSVTELAQAEIAQLKVQLSEARAFETELISTRAAMTQSRLVMAGVQAEIAAAESRANDAISTATSTVGHELDALRTQLADARAETESLRGKMVEVDLLAAQKAETEIAALNARLTDASVKAETLRVRLAEASQLEEQVAVAEESLRQARSHISTLEVELQSSQEKIVGVDAEAIGRLQQQNMVLETEVTETRGAVTALEAARFEIERSENLITNLQGQVERLRRERTVEDNAVADSLRLDGDRLTAELATAQAELADLSTGQEQLLVARETIENLELELQVSQQIREEAVEFAALLTQAELRVSVLETELARRETDRSQIGSLESEITALRAQIDNAAAESAQEIDQRIVELSNELEIARAAETELRTTKQELARARSEVAALSTQVEVARTNLAEMDNLRSANEVAEQRLGEIESELVAANQQLNRLTQEGRITASLESELQTLRTQRAVSEQEIVEQSQRIAALNAEFESARLVGVELGEANDALDEARLLISRFESEIVNARSRVSALEEQVRAASASETDQRIIELSNELQIARAAEMELGVTKQGLEQARNEVATLRTQIEEARKNLAEMDNLRRTNEVAERRIGEFENELVAANEQLNRLKEEAQSTTALESDLQTLRAERDAAEAAMAEQSQRIAELTTELESARLVEVELGEANQSLAAAGVLISGFESEITTARSRVSSLEEQLRATAVASASETDQRIVELSNELEIAQMVEAELATTKEALAAARNEVAMLVDQARVNLAQADDLRSDNEVAERRIGEVESELVAANDQLNRLSREVQANASLDSQLQTLRAERGAAETAISEQTQRIAALTAELESARAVEVELGATRQSLEEARGFIAGLETEIATARSGLAGMNSLRTEKETAEQRFQQVQIQLDRANGRVEALIKEAQAQAPLNSQLASVRSERDAAVSAATEMSEELDAAEVAINEQTLLIADLTAEQIGLEEDLQASQRVVDAALAAQASAVNEAGTNEALRSQVSNLESQVRNYEGQMSDDRASTAKEFSALTLQLQRSRETAKSLSEANRALLASREVDAESTDSQVTQLQVEASVLDDQNSSLQAENLALQTALVEAQAEPKAPADWQLQQSALTRELETLTRDLRTAESYATTVTELTGVNEQLQVTMAELESRLTNANTREQQAQRREAVLQGDLDARGFQLGSLEAQLAGVAKLPAQVSGLAENLADVRAENLALQTALAEARAAPKPPAAWQQRESAMNRQLVTLTRDLATAQSYATTVDELSGTNSQLQASINEMQSRLAAAGASEQASAQQQARLEREIVDQRQAQSELERQLAGLVSMPTQVVALETAVADARADNQALERALSEARAAPKPTADWQQRENQLVRQVETLTRDLATAESYATTVNELSGANEQLQASMSQLQNRLADANSRDDQARSRASALESELAEQKEARANVESNLARLSNLPEQVASMRTAMAEIRGQFEVVSTENMDLKAELSAAEVALNEQQTAVDAAREAERLKLESELTSFTRATSNLTAQLERSRSDLARANAARDSSEIRVTSLERQLATTSNLTGQVEELSRRVREAESEIATRRTSSLNLQQTLTNERNRLEREIASLSRDNRSLSGRLSQAQTTLDQIASAARVLNPNTNLGGSVSRSGALPRADSDDGGDNSATDRFHVVREGDSLTRISLRYYGTGSRWQEIYQANRETLSASNSLQPGQRLRIP